MKAGDTLQLTGISMDGMNTISTPMPILLLQDTDDPISLIREASMEYCRTRQGLVDYDGNGRNFDLADFWYQVPNEICVKHGFKKQDGNTEAMTQSADEALFELEDLKPTKNIIDDIYKELTAGPVGELKDMLYYACGMNDFTFLENGITDHVAAVIRAALERAAKDQSNWHDMLEYWLDHCVSVYAKCKDGIEGVTE